jgi:hypothetical protein
MIEDGPIAGSAIVLTESSAGIGCYYVYDTEKSRRSHVLAKVLR